MAATNSTIREMITIIRNHVDEETLEKIMNDLSKINGNAAFRETIIRTRHEFTRKRKIKSNNDHMMKEGDTVEVKHFSMFGGEKWTSAIVTKVYDNKFEVQFIKDKEFMVLSFDDRDEIWR